MLASAMECWPHISLDVSRRRLPKNSRFYLFLWLQTSIIVTSYNIVREHMILFPQLHFWGSSQEASKGCQIAQERTVAHCNYSSFLGDLAPDPQFFWEECTYKNKESLWFFQVALELPIVRIPNIFHSAALGTASLETWYTVVIWSHLR